MTKQFMNHVRLRRVYRVSMVSHVLSGMEVPESHAVQKISRMHETCCRADSPSSRVLQSFIHLL